MWKITLVYTEHQYYSSQQAMGLVAFKSQQLASPCVFFYSVLRQKLEKKCHLNNFSAECVDLSILIHFLF